MEHQFLQTISVHLELWLKRSYRTMLSVKKGWLCCQGYEFETDPAEGAAFSNCQKMGNNDSKVPLRSTC